MRSGSKASQWTQGISDSVLPAHLSLASLPLSAYREIFPGRCYLLAELHHRGNDQERLDRLAALAHRAGVPLVAAGDVHFHVPQRQPLSDVLSAVRHGCTVATAGELLFPNAQRYLRSPEEMAVLFARYPEALQRTLEIARQTTFSLDELRYEYPEELAPAGQTPMEYLTRLAWEGRGIAIRRACPTRCGASSSTSCN